MSANPYRIDFPTRPKLVFREESKVSYVDENDAVASIAMVTENCPSGQAAILLRREGKDDIHMFKGPLPGILEAFRDFEARATVAAPPTHNGRPNGPQRAVATLAAGLMVGAVVAALATGAAVKFTQDRQQPIVAAQPSPLEQKLAKQLELIEKMTPGGVPGMSAEAPSAPGMMPPATSARIETVKVKPADRAAAEALKQPAGAVAVPKDLPELPGLAPREASASAVTDAEPARPKAGVEPRISVTETGPAAPLPTASASVEAKLPPAGSSEPARSSEVKTSEIKTPEAKTPEAKTAEAKPEADAKTADAKTSAKGMPAMTPAEAQELLATLEKIKSQASEGGELTPELLKQLPMEVARALVGTGISTVSAKERAERAERMARIVKLPAHIINAHRGRDGIADIPDQDSWVANGGRISIPLPGGGDVVEPGILREFGLQP